MEQAVVVLVTYVEVILTVLKDYPTLALIAVKVHSQVAVRNVVKGYFLKIVAIAKIVVRVLILVKYWTVKIVGHVETVSLLVSAVKLYVNALLFH